MENARDSTCGEFGPGIFFTSGLLDGRTSSTDPESFEIAPELATFRSQLGILSLCR